MIDSRLKVFAWPPADERFDLFISVVGFEQRAIHAARLISDRAEVKVAFEFQERRVGSFATNKAWYLSRGFALEPFLLKTFHETLCEMLLEQSGSFERPLSICCDISSMSRPMLAEVIFCLSTLRRPVRVQFVYSPAMFSPPVSLPEPVLTRGPVIPEYAGWSTHPERPATLVVGVGYEYTRALGAFEYLEPSDAWIFSPTGIDHRFDKAAETVNADLANAVVPSHIKQYNIRDPFESFIRLESLVFSLAENSRPILVPFGPKLFTLCCLLVAQIHYPEVSVWRISGEQNDWASNVRAKGELVGIGAEWTS